MHDKHGCNLLISSQREDATLIPDMPTRAKPGVEEDTVSSRLHKHLCRVAAFFLREHKQFRPHRRGPQGQVKFEHRWVTLGVDELAALVWEHVLTHHSLLTVPEKQSYRSSRIGEDQAFRSAQRAAQYAVDTWDVNVVEKAQYDGRAAQMKASPRGKTVTADMVRPHLDSLQGLTIRQAAERLASWDWDTPKRPSVDTFRRRLRELGFTGEGGTKRTRQPEVNKHMVQALDGMTVEAKAEELGVSARTVYRAQETMTNMGANRVAESEEKVSNEDRFNSSVTTMTDMGANRVEDLTDKPDPWAEWLNEDGSLDVTRLLRAVP